MVMVVVDLQKPTSHGVRNSKLSQTDMRSQPRSYKPKGCGVEGYETHPTNGGVTTWSGGPVQLSAITASK